MGFNLLQHQPQRRALSGDRHYFGACEDAGCRQLSFDSGKRPYSLARQFSETRNARVDDRDKRRKSVRIALLHKFDGIAQSGMQFGVNLDLEGSYQLFTQAFQFGAHPDYLPLAACMYHSVVNSSRQQREGRVSAADERVFYVYLLYRDEARTDPFYVGKGHGERLNEHEALKESGRTFNRHKHHTIRRCLTTLGYVPKDVFADSLTEVDAFDLERALIAWWGRRDLGAGCLTNLTDGGEGTAGCVYSAEQRAQNSARLKGRKRSPRSPETRERISMALTAKPKSPAHRERLRLASTGKVQSSEARAKNSAANTGRIVGGETRLKLSLALKGRARSAEHSANISRAKKGKKQAPEIIARQVASRAVTMAGRPGPNAGRVFSLAVREKMRQAQIARWAARREMGVAADG